MDQQGDEFLSHLAKVPGVTLDQAARLLARPEDEALAALRRLEREGVIESETFLLRRLRRGIDGPLWSSRWGSELRPNVLEHAIRDKRYGASSLERVWWLGTIREDQVSHDVAGVTELYLWHLTARPEWTWSGESPRRGARVPDATVTTPGGATVALDFVSEYRSGKIRSIAKHYEARGMPIELF